MDGTVIDDGTAGGCSLFWLNGDDEGLGLATMVQLDGLVFEA